MKAALLTPEIIQIDISIPQLFIMVYNYTAPRIVLYRGRILMKNNQLLSTISLLQTDYFRFNLRLLTD